jgi:flagellar basal body rod protein FlgC
VSVVEELSNMMSASRSYEANLLVVRKVREMARAALQIGSAG